MRRRLPLAHSPRTTAAACLVAALLWSLPAAAQQVARVTAEATPTTVRIGEEIDLTVKISHAPHLPILRQPDFTGSLGVFRIKEHRAVEPTEATDPAGRVHHLVITAFETGTHDIPPFEWAWRTEDGSEQKASSDPIPVTVESVIPRDATSAGFLDIADPVQAGRPGLTRDAQLILVFGAIFLAALLTAVFLLLFRRRRKAAVLPPPRPAHEMALERFERLRTGDLLKAGHEKEFGSVASDILREYLDHRHGVNARDMTTEEILSALHTGENTRHLVAPIEAYLHECDRIKFAKHVPPQDRKIALLDAGIALVNNDKPTPEERAEEAGEPGTATIGETEGAPAGNREMEEETATAASGEGRP